MSDIPGGAEGADKLDSNAIPPEPIDGEEPILDDELLPGEPEPEEPEPGEEPEPKPVAAPNRAQTRIQTLRERAERAEREAAELRGYRQALEQQPRQPAVDPAAQQRQQLDMLRQRWEQMSPADAILEALQYGAQQQQQNSFLQQRLIEDRIDQQAYATEARTSAQHQRYRDRVEQIVASERRNGNFAITRTDVLYRLIGEDVVNRATRAAPTQNRQAAARAAAQQTRPTGARGDAGGGRRPVPGSAEDDDRIIEEGLRAGFTI